MDTNLRRGLTECNEVETSARWRCGICIKISFTFCRKGSRIRLHGSVDPTMKRIFPALLTITLAAAAFLTLDGCKKEAASAAPTTPAPVESTSFKSAEPNSFQEVTSKLDSGGDLYLYLSTEQWLKNLSDSVGKYRDVVSSIPGLGDNQEAVTNGFNVVTRLIKDSGLENVSGVGMSSIAREPGVYRTRAVVHHYSGQGDGFIWSILGKQAHDLDGLNLLPADTALATFHDVDVAEMW